jgi:hypothetical protein
MAAYCEACGNTWYRRWGCRGMRVCAPCLVCKTKGKAPFRFDRAAYDRYKLEQRAERAALMAQFKAIRQQHLAQLKPVPPRSSKGFQVSPRVRGWW